MTIETKAPDKVWSLGPAGLQLSAHDGSTVTVTAVRISTPLVAHLNALEERCARLEAALREIALLQICR